MYGALLILSISVHVRHLVDLVNLCANTKPCVTDCSGLSAGMQYFKNCRAHPIKNSESVTSVQEHVLFSVGLFLFSEDFLRRAWRIYMLAFVFHVWSKEKGRILMEECSACPQALEGAFTRLVWFVYLINVNDVVVVSRGRGRAVPCIFRIKTDNVT